MSPTDVIESYVLDVIRRLPAKERDEIGLELRGLLNEMLAERAQAENRPADDPMVLAMLKGFGSPAQISARYRSPGIVIIPEDQTRSFAVAATVGVALQWALTLPRVFGGEPLASWWLTWGLGSLWWPGLMVMVALVTAWARDRGYRKPVWRPRAVDPERINRGAAAFALVWFAIGAAFLIALPWIARALPGPLPEVFALDTTFLRERALPVLLLWLGALANRAVVLWRGRWSHMTRRLDLSVNLAFLALFAWWLLAGPIFRAATTDEGAKAGIVLVMLLIVVDLTHRLYRRARIRMPRQAES